MNRNETFPPILVSSLVVHLAWASLEVCVEDVEQIQVLVSGADSDVKDLRMVCEENRLLVEQPAYGINLKNLGAERWMQIMLRLPATWKGAVDLSTISAPIKARGLTGTDLTMDSVSGCITATGLSSIATGLHTVSGDVKASDIQGEKLSLRSVSGSITVTDAGFDVYHVTTASGQADLDMNRPFQRVDSLSVSGDVRIFTPMDHADAVLRSVSGRLRTRGVSIVPEAAPLRANSVSGDLEINCSYAATYNEEE